MLPVDWSGEPGWASVSLPPSSSGTYTVSLCRTQSPPSHPRDRKDHTCHRLIDGACWTTLDHSRIYPGSIFSPSHQSSAIPSTPFKVEHYLPRIHPAPSPTLPPSFLPLQSHPPSLLITFPLPLDESKLIPRFAKRVSALLAAISLRLMPRLLMAVADFSTLRSLC